MSIFAHDSGCNPLEPCIPCQMARFLQEKLSPDDFRNFVSMAAQRSAAKEPPNFRLDTLQLSVRTANVLKNERIETIGQLAGISEAEFLRIPNAGRKSLQELKEVMEPLGYCFRGSKK